MEYHMRITHDGKRTTIICNDKTAPFHLWESNLFPHSNHEDWMEAAMLPKWLAWNGYWSMDGEKKEEVSYLLQQRKCLELLVTSLLFCKISWEGRIWSGSTVESWLELCEDECKNGMYESKNGRYYTLTYDWSLNSYYISFSLLD